MPFPRQQLLLLAVLSLVGRSQAYGCYYDIGGNYVCDGMNYGTRVGIAAAIIILVVVGLLAFVFAKRRRMARYRAQYGQQNGGQLPTGVMPQVQQGYGYMPTSQGNGLNASAQYYQPPQNSYSYGPDASTWHAPPPAYVAPPDSKNGNEAGNQQSFAPPAGPPPNQASNDAGYRV